MLPPVVGFCLLAFGITVNCQDIVPDAYLSIETDTAAWIEGNTTATIESLKEFTRVQGVAEESELAVEVKPGKFAILSQITSGGCLWDITSCPERKITYTFWLKVLAWRESGSQAILQTAQLFGESGFIVTVGTSSSADKIRVFFNGDGKDYEYFFARETVEQWAYIAAVIDANEETMKVYINGAELPESDLEISSRIRGALGSIKMISIGQSTQTPDYYFAGFNIYYQALSQTELENIYTAAVNGPAIPVTDSTTTTITETMMTTPITKTTTSPSSTTEETVSPTNAPSTTPATPPPKTTSSTPNSCAEVDADWKDAFQQWTVDKEKYSKAFDEWKKTMNEEGECQ